MSKNPRYTLPDNIFRSDEIQVSARNLGIYRDAIGIISDIFKVFYQALSSTEEQYSEHSKRAIMLLIAMNFKTFISAYDRAIKGYIGESETLLKRAIESLLSQTYFYLHEDKAKEWCENKITLNDLESNRRVLAHKLDKLNAEKPFFPTNIQDFFEKYIYEIGYANANTLAHLDYDKVHHEIYRKVGDNNVFVLGPNYDEDLSKTSFTRIVMYSMAQLTLFHVFLGKEYSEEYSQTFKEFEEYLGKSST